MRPRRRTTGKGVSSFALDGPTTISVSSSSLVEVHPGSVGKSILPSRSLSLPSAQAAGSGIPIDVFVSSSSAADVQPGSAGKSILPSPSLSLPSAQRAGAGGVVPGGGGGGAGGSVSSLSAADEQPGSEMFVSASILPSPSLSRPSLHCAGSRSFALFGPGQPQSVGQSILPSRSLS